MELSLHFLFWTTTWKGSNEHSIDFELKDGEGGKIRDQINNLSNIGNYK